MRFFRFSGIAAVLLVIAWVEPNHALAQRIGQGYSAPGITVTMADHPYDIQGNTALLLLGQMRMLGPAGRWTSFPYRYRWTYQTRSLASAFGYETNECGVQDFTLRFTVDAHYPRWTPPDDADAELVAAWEAFTESIHQYWLEYRNFMTEVARETSWRVDRIEESCGVVRAFTNRVVRETYAEMSQTRALERAAGDRVLVRWPPVGFEGLLSEPPTELSEDRGTRLTMEAERISASFGSSAAADIRPSGMSGIVGGLHKRGTEDLVEAWGFTDAEETDSITAEEIFRFPALAEAVVSALAEAMHGEGLVDLHAPLSTYLPELDKNLGSISLDHLLHHQSGLDNATPQAQVWSEILDRLDDQALFTDPGVVYSYSRYDYPLAVRALERTLGENLASAATRWVFEPREMENSALGEEKDGLPIVLTTAPDLLRFASALMGGEEEGAAPPPSFAPGSPGLLDSRGRWFDRGLWHDRVEGETRIGLMCAAGPDSDPVAFQVFPGYGAALAFWARTRNPRQTWPTVSAAFLLEGLGLELGIGTDLFEPRRIRGDGQLQGGSNLCVDPPPSTLRVDDPGPPAPAEDWAGTYGNGEQVIQLLDQEGFLSMRAGMGSDLQVSHHKDDIYFTTIAERPLWLFRLFKDESGRRYAVLGDRAYIHQGDGGM